MTPFLVIIRFLTYNLTLSQTNHLYQILRKLHGRPGFVFFRHLFSKKAAAFRR